MGLTFTWMTIGRAGIGVTAQSVTPALRQAIVDLVVVALDAHESVLGQRTPVGGANPPIATEMNSYPSMSGFQNSADPHTEQNPRRTFSDGDTR